MVRDLRIGNFLHYINEPKLQGPEQVVVNSISEDGINIFYNQNFGYIDCEYRAEDLAPIPLTEEWLVRFGFEMKYDDDGGGDYDLIIQNGRYRFILRTEVDGWIALHQRDIGLKYELLCQVNYIHQLQNLHFALTGEELKIK